MSKVCKDTDLIITVPLPRKKLGVRDYNQSTFIAEGISNVMQIPFSEELLIRNLSTESQTQKSRYNRYENMQEVFKVALPEEVIDKHILLVNDVITTGATLGARANELLKSGASKVSIAALAFPE